MLFSIVTPVYNRAHLLKNTLQSALNQSYSNYEIIVVDDGSSDNPEAVVLSLNSHIIRFIKQENKERGAARNAGAKAAMGKYICFLDSDDRLYPFHLEEAAAQISKSGFPEIVATNYEIIDNNKVIVSRGFNPQLKQLNQHLMQYGNILSANGVFIRKDIFLQHLFSEVRELSGSEDYELWIRLACLYPVYCSGRVTSTIIQHNERSVLHMNAQNLIKRQQTFLELTLSNPNLKAAFPDAMSQLQFEAYSYIALHLILARTETTTACMYMLKAIWATPKNVFRRRMLAICKHLLLNAIR
ncbi:hypothetical protein C7N43_14945 [Sphingobacteriales bacterium UPWRP_1]|nr:hypothetical protein BVG80_04810 [Sphingobacteriales bacterium TSM_CSM]PSJ76211.1 hypothetical protein C7N43_14945 [Sphingobacteriales bacterium UPWRP_1]